MKEKWRPVIGYEGLYEVSSFGRVKSLDRKIHTNNNHDRFLKGRILVIKKNIGGYPICSLSNKKSRSVRVHRIVARSFILNPDNKPCVNHIDNSRTNNCVSNLEWITQKDNIIYSFSQNRMSWRRANGEENGLSKLTTLQVKEIRELQNKSRRIDVARKYNVDPCNISAIWDRKTWKHI